MSFAVKGGDDPQMVYHDNPYVPARESEQTCPTDCGHRLAKDHQHGAWTPDK